MVSTPSKQSVEFNSRVDKFLEFLSTVDFDVDEDDTEVLTETLRSLYVKSSFSADNELGDLLNVRAGFTMLISKYEIKSAQASRVEEIQYHTHKAKAEQELGGKVSDSKAHSWVLIQESYKPYAMAKQAVTAYLQILTRIDFLIRDKKEILLNLNRVR